jgi:hypothetical protein
MSLFFKDYLQFVEGNFLFNPELVRLMPYEPNTNMIKIEEMKHEEMLEIIPLLNGDEKSILNDYCNFKFG